MYTVHPLTGCVSILAATLALLPGAAAGQKSAATDLLDLSIEELSEIKVTSASRRPELLAETAAAVFVITSEDIRRSGATRLPEVLRLAPGLHVAQLSARRWAVTARGFNGEFANKLLVLMDGRSIYTPVHSGVNWDLRDLVLEDVERIEVIRGPGAAQWGANAVNGVINIITKSAHETRGGHAAVIGGTELGSVVTRWGGRLGQTGSYRIFAKYTDRDDSVTSSGEDAEDAWRHGRVGFRADWEPAQNDTLMLQGDLYEADVNRLFPAVSAPEPPYLRAARLDNRARGGHVLGRWSRAVDRDNEFSVQSYLDWYEANPLQAEEQVLTVDLDFQHRFRTHERHQVVWGLGYRHIRDDFANTFTVAFEPAERSYEIYSAFVQDTIALTDDLAVTLGAKFEHNDYTGEEFQPSVQLAWTPDARYTVWGSVSRAARTPSRAESDIRLTVLDPAGTTETRYLGESELDAEELVAQELGYRVSPHEGLYLDFTAFRHEYEEIITTRVGTPFVDPAAPGRLVVPASFANGVNGTVRGVEIAARWQVLPGWRLALAQSYLDLDLDAEPQVTPGSDASENAAPQYKTSLFSRLDLAPKWQLDGWLRYVDRLHGPDIPGYTELNLRLGWQPRPEVGLSLVGENLLDSQHLEYRDVGLEIERAVFLRLDWKF
ncbi:TonB-dependent receptor plug domain-containing protein [Gilvimarinus sp. F26214L]|uniref:TonB-dependent receptor plug domain-containing protein n=1 Tax=Gilvimarinus sp. DZF01 TaxID=3461371 RepID=UPI00404567D3